MANYSYIYQNGRRDFMKIAFLGDSITEGIPGVSYVDIISKNNNEFTVVNLGKGGDTVSSLYRRIQNNDDLVGFDVFVLFIGINDVFGKLTWQYKLLKALRRQQAARDIHQFKKGYQKLLSELTKYNKRIIVVPPLLLGEQVNNVWNKEVNQLVEIIKDTIKHTEIEYIDVRKAFIEELKGKQISDYMPMKLLKVVKDVLQLENSDMVDQRSESRGLHVTVDGVHINSKGAKILSDMISAELKK